jgi:hypothetical protein
MTIIYEHINEDIENMIIEHISRTNEDGSVSWIPIEPKNSEYQEYLRWAEENNV